MDKENKECCESTKSSCSCCGGAKKLFLGIILGVLLASISIGFFAAGKCIAYNGSICPFTQMHR